ncbi:MAG: hypothetical protein AABY13_00670 [Nanoarchaeota archaeon]|mgnify:CR=1 FL=1
MDPAVLTEGLRIAKLSSARKKSGWKRYDGGIRKICDAIIEDCWNGEFYTASAGHFCQFYTRDFGIACKWLDADRCRSTLSYALAKFREADAVTVAITPAGKPFDFPTFSPDSLAYLLHALRVCKADAVVAAHQDFLEAQITAWCGRVIDEDGFVRRNVHYGGMRDHAVRSSSCYDNAMVLLLKQEAHTLGLKTPPIALTPEIFIKEFWVDDHCKDERDNDVISGDASVVPFWLGIIDDAKMANAMLQRLHRMKLDKPLPLAYSAPGQSPKMIWQNVFSNGWEAEAKWMQLGLMYASIARRHHKELFEEIKDQLAQNILTNQNILEVFTPKGEPYTSTFYHADEGMLWGAALARNLLS